MGLNARMKATKKETALMEHDLIKDKVAIVIYDTHTLYIK
jgi:hypothetical protein